jgi:electron transport complex protein RnfG
MKSSLKNMVFVLLGICLVTSAAVAFVYNVTEEPIEKAKQQKVAAALKAVLPVFDNAPEAVDGVYKAMMGSEVVGYAVESTSPNGFNGNVKLMVGFDAEGTIVNIDVLEQAETPGLGSLMAEPDNNLLRSFKGKRASDVKMTVRKDGGDVDALTAATITSRAYVSAVDKAFNAYLTKTQGAAADGYSGATELATPAEEQKGGNDE